MASDRIATPLAILCGFGLLSLVVWQASQRIVGALGDAHGVPPGSDTSAPLPSNISPGARQAPKFTELDAELHVRDQAQDGLLEQRDAYRRSCSTRIPVASAGALPEIARFDVDIAFDPSGHETKRTFRLAGPPAPNWLACVEQQKTPPLSAPPLGRPVTVTVALTLP